MKLFLDTNVVLDYLAKRQPFAEDAHHIILEGSLKGWVLCISALSFTTIDYVLRKLYTPQRTRRPIREESLIIKDIIT